MHQNAPFIPLNIKNRLLKEWGNPPPLLQPPPSRPAAARIGDALSAYSCKISFYSQTYLHPCRVVFLYSLNVHDTNESTVR